MTSNIKFTFAVVWKYMLINSNLKWGSGGLLDKINDCQSDDTSSTPACHRVLLPPPRGTKAIPLSQAYPTTRVLKDLNILYVYGGYPPKSSPLDYRSIERFKYSVCLIPFIGQVNIIKF